MEKYEVTLHKLNTDTIRGMLRHGAFSLTDVIDAVVAENRMIGVGLVSLAEDVSAYIIHNDHGYDDSRREVHKDVGIKKYQDRRGRIAFEAWSYCCDAQPLGELDDHQGRCENCREMSIFYYMNYNIGDGGQAQKGSI